MLIELTNQRAASLLRELEALHLIRVIEENIIPAEPDQPATKLSTKYRGILNETQGRQLDEHIEQMRSEWSNT